MELISLSNLQCDIDKDLNFSDIFIGRLIFVEMTSLLNGINWNVVSFLANAGAMMTLVDGNQIGGRDGRNSLLQCFVNPNFSHTRQHSTPMTATDSPG